MGWFGDDNCLSAHHVGLHVEQMGRGEKGERVERWEERRKRERRREGRERRQGDDWREGARLKEEKGAPRTKGLKLLPLEPP